MRNLKLLYKKSHKYEAVNARLMTNHAFDNTTFIYDGKVVKSFDHVNEEIKELCSLEDVIAMEFVQLNDCLCLATGSGEIITYNFMNNDCETVGLINDGIECMSWSPDQELVVFISKSYQVIVMYPTFDVLVESSLHDKAAKEFLTVGWGKKETQFHGSVGKDARKKEVIEITNIEELDKTITCCWRGDSEYFAVNYVGNNGRMFKVYNKEGSLEYVSEICANLQVPMAWKPSGLWIAKPEVHKDKYTITLFERNGLKHNELKLPFSPDDECVVNLCWNQDSDILLIETQRQGKKILYFYTISNYHWYLKYYMEFDVEFIYSWSQNYLEPKQFHIFTTAGEYSTIKFDFTTNNSSSESVNDESVVAVIDGKSLLLTNFKSQMVPPPMSSHQVSFDNSINIVEFLQKADENFDSNSFLTVDPFNNFQLYRNIFSDAVNGGKFKDVEKIKEFKIEIDGIISHVHWMNSNNVIFAINSTVYLYAIDSASIDNELKLEEVIGSLIKIDELSYAAQLIDGTIINFNSDVTLTDDSHFKLPEFCEKVVGTRSNDETLFYALKSLKKKLYLRDKEIATEVTSFTLTNDKEFVMYTTISELKFIKIEKNASEVIESRRVERGSRIVLQVKDKSQIIFQLPRGNLETISPRILSLKIVKKFVNSGNYKMAFDILRKERINLNLLVDLNVQKFFNELVTFIQQIDNINWLNLFLTELKDEDVTLTMYKYCETSNENIDKKSEVICGKMLEAFRQMDERKYLLPMITCHVKSGKIESALQLIWSVKCSGTGDKDADDALKYLLYLIDINELYNIALGMYDFQLVLFVAQKSQKDPKEYVPFLQELNNFDPVYAKYKIDCYLKRFGKAVGHIAALCEEDIVKFNECIELVKKHNLYDSALAAFVKYENCYQTICILYADHLRVKGKLLEASLMYERGGDFQQALSSARNILDWQRCLILARKFNYSDDGIKDLAMKLIISLSDLGRYQEASKIVHKFCDSKKLLIETLINGRLYSEALLEVTSDGDGEMLENIVKPLIVQHLKDVVKTISDDKVAFLQQKERLLSVREEKNRKLLNPQNDDDDDDMFSDTTSINSQSSRNTVKTFRSSKNRRKHERKLLNLKEGNKFEDIALVDSLWKLVHKILSAEYQNTVRDLIKAGVEINSDEEARNLQRTFKDLLLTIKNSLDEIWIPKMLSAGKYPTTEDELEQYNMSLGNKLSYDLVKPEQRFAPKMNVIEFEMDMFRDNTKKN